MHVKPPEIEEPNLHETYHLSDEGDFLPKSHDTFTRTNQKNEINNKNEGKKCIDNQLYWETLPPLITLNQFNEEKIIEKYKNIEPSIIGRLCPNCNRISIAIIKQNGNFLKCRICRYEGYISEFKIGLIFPDGFELILE